MEISTIKRIMIPLTLILSAWLFFEIIEFLRPGGANQPMAFCIVKISVLSSTIIGLSTHGNEENFVKFDKLLERLKALPKDKE